MRPLSEESSTASSVIGFTLIELSIVLVIIGLIVGGVLVGRDLISAAAVRAQISQIEKYNTATNTFRGKYGYLPGDIPDPYASQFGFASRSSSTGRGDGNGSLEGAGGNCCNQATGELAMFWVDLSAAKLIEGTFNTATSNTPPGADISATGVGAYLPEAKIGGGNYVYAWEGGSHSGTWQMTGVNYFGISAVTVIHGASDYGSPASAPSLTVAQTYAMDKKTDDGLPEYGNVISVYLNGQKAIWSDGTVANSQTAPPPPDTTSISPSVSTCYDNGGVSSAVKQYSLTQSNGNGVNCGISFKFQ